MATPTRRSRPQCLVIAGPNGAGKTTLATEFLLRETGIVHFVNADLIASGLSPLRPALAAVAAGRLLISEIDRLAAARADFAFESTLAGLTHAHRLRALKAAGYRIEIVFLWLPGPTLARRRVDARVRAGGHAVAPADIERRFTRGWWNFQNVYRALADRWVMYDNSGSAPLRVEEGP